MGQSSFVFPHLFVSPSFIHTSLSGTGFLFSPYQRYQVKKVRCAQVESPRTRLNLEPKICPCRPNWDRCLHFIYKSFYKNIYGERPRTIWMGQILQRTECLQSEERRQRQMEDLKDLQFACKCMRTRLIEHYKWQTRNPHLSNQTCVHTDAPYWHNNTHTLTNTRHS